MDAKEAREQVTKNLKDKRQLEEDNARQAERDRYYRRIQFPEEWIALADGAINDAIKRCQFVTKVQITNDLDFKRKHIMNWAADTGYKVEFSQQHYAEESKDNETGQCFGDYWFQHVTISWDHIGD